VTRFSALLLAIGITVTGCGGDERPQGPASVTIAWAANREAGVNRAGGGYEVAITGLTPINVPYSSGPMAPTSTTLSLERGVYTASVRAYAALDAAGGSTRTFSAAQTLTFAVVLQ